MGVRSVKNIILLSLAVIFIFCVSSAALALSDEEKAARAFKFARGLFDMEKYPEAAGELQKFLSFYEKTKYSEYALYLLGESFYRSGHYAKALERYGQFVKKYADSKLIDDVNYSAGYASYAMDRGDDALSYFQKVCGGAKAELKNDAMFKCAKIYLEKKTRFRLKKIFPITLAPSILKKTRQTRKNARG